MTENGGCVCTKVRAWPFLFLVGILGGGPRREKKRRLVAGNGKKGGGEKKMFVKKKKSNGKKRRKNSLFPSSSFLSLTQNHCPSPLPPSTASALLHEFLFF